MAKGTLPMSLSWDGKVVLDYVGDATVNSKVFVGEKQEDLC
jgi:hypothetical protein